MSFSCCNVFSTEIDTKDAKVFVEKLAIVNSKKYYGTLYGIFNASENKYITVVFGMLTPDTTRVSLK